ncbi:MAG: heme-binding domain-containing protein [Ferruginibacter sp.]
MRKFLKRLLILIVILLALVQFYPKAAKNISETASANDITTKYPVPDSIKSILKVSCYDCHSNNTVYPWYSKLQPVSWWLNDHILEGKKELNFSEFASYPLKRQYKKLKKINDEVKSGDMPLSSYTFIHRYAKLDDVQKSSIANWVNSLQDTMKAHYPIDSLISKN